MRTAVSAAMGEAELLKSSSKEGFVQCDLAREVIEPFSLFSTSSDPGLALPAAQQSRSGGIPP